MRRCRRFAGLDNNHYNGKSVDNGGVPDCILHTRSFQQSLYVENEVGEHDRGAPACGVWWGLGEFWPTTLNVPCVQTFPPVSVCWTIKVSLSSPEIESLSLEYHCFQHHVNRSTKSKIYRQQSIIWRCDCPAIVIRSTPARLVGAGEGALVGPMPRKLEDAVPSKFLRGTEPNSTTVELRYKVLSVSVRFRTSYPKYVNEVLL